jgi:GTP 3',8-cyclase
LIDRRHLRPRLVPNRGKPCRHRRAPRLIDPFARAITYLRVSVTDRCDFRCVYCMSEHMEFLPKAELLTLEELDRLCTAFVGLGVEKLRITGGEPLGPQRHHDLLPRHVAPS